ncbi:MAG: VCBS repeat-containing protein [Saprospirales bacterium]|nr:VCBS repeat-containing protein [Saprospirales bacterium]
MKKQVQTLLFGLLLAYSLPAQISFQDIPNLPFFDDQGYLRGITWVDVDGDNDLDVSVSGATGTSPNFVNATAIFIQDGSGAFSNTGLISSTQLNAFGQGWADYDNDGDLDVYYGATWNSGGVNELWRNEGGAGFTQITNSGSTPNTPQPYEGTVSWADYDNDGFADLFLARWNQMTNRLYHNNGDGTFTDITSGALVADPGWTSGGYWADFDNDRDLDLYVVNYQIGAAAPGANDLFRNNGDGTFTKLTTAGNVVTDAQNSRSANWLDINNDGWLDLFVGNQFSQDKIYFNNGDGTFSTQALGDAGYTTWSSNWGDIDNDGDQDLFTMGFWGYESRCWRNDGNGTFTDITASFPNIYPLQTSGSGSNAVIVVDYDRDGWLDLHIAQPDAIADHLYKNLGDGCQSWLEVECVGVQSNRAAIGTTLRAKATINGTAVWQMRQVSAQTAATGQNPLWQHFGFGDATVIDSLVVEWPSGATCVFEGVSVNQLVEIEETCSIQTILSNPAGYAGEDAVVDWCEGAGPIDLFQSLGGNPDTGGQWVDMDFEPVSMPVEGAGLWYYLTDGPCPDTAKVTVNSHPLPVVTLMPGDTTLDAGSVLNLLAMGADTYTWAPADQLSCANCPDPEFTAAESVELTVTGEDAFGCQASASIGITVLSNDLRFELPNAFTPDNDGSNDTFKPITGGVIFQSYLMRVYNRWGALVYETTKPENGWNGQFDGKPMPSDVYAFYMQYTLTDGTAGTEKGEVTLLR